MKLIRDLSALSGDMRSGAVAIGNFDGVHHGHARIVARLIAKARQVGGPAVVFTFDPHPVRLLRPAEAPPPLTWTDRKAELLAELGVDSIIAYRTDEALLRLTDRQFFDEIVRGRIAARAMVEGPNFFFGRDRMGTIDVLRKLTAEAGMSLEVVEPVVIDGEIVSSSRVRRLLAAGRVDEARRMLTRPYRIRGMVTHGVGRGARIGFPTANLDAIDTLLPGVGVYAGQAVAHAGRWPAAIHVGPNPTFAEHALKVEVHLIGFDGQLYGEPLEADFVARLRDIRPFAGAEELREQLACDVLAARRVHDEWQARERRARYSSGGLTVRTPTPVSEYRISNRELVHPMSIHWPRFVEVVRAHRRFLLTSHIRPDCDALGSELGLAGVLESLGKEVLIVNPQKTPPHLEFIDHERKIRSLGEDVQMADLDAIEILLVLDTSAWAQLGGMAEVLRTTKAKKMLLDHHVSQDDLEAESFKDTEAEATGRLVLEAALHLGVKITPAIATPLFAAMATDTGWFRFASTSGDTLRRAGQLVDAGARPNAIYNALYEQDTLSRLLLIGRTIARAQTDEDGRLIHTAVFRDDFEATGALPSDTEDLVNMTLTVAGTEAAVILVEQPAGGFKVSFRSRAEVDCSQVAEAFGGGGHKAAAGAYVNQPFEAARSTVLDAVRRAMR